MSSQTNSSSTDWYLELRDVVPLLGSVEEKYLGYDNALIDALTPFHIAIARAFFFYLHVIGLNVVFL